MLVAALAVGVAGQAGGPGRARHAAAVDDGVGGDAAGGAAELVGGRAASLAALAGVGEAVGLGLDTNSVINPLRVRSGVRQPAVSWICLLGGQCECPQRARSLLSSPPSSLSLYLTHRSYIGSTSGFVDAMTPFIDNADHSNKAVLAPRILYEHGAAAVGGGRGRMGRNLNPLGAHAGCGALPFLHLPR